MGIAVYILPLGDLFKPEINILWSEIRPEISLRNLQPLSRLPVVGNPPYQIGLIFTLADLN